MPASATAATAASASAVAPDAAPVSMAAAASCGVLGEVGAVAAAGGASARCSSGSATADVLDSTQILGRSGPGTQAAAAHAATPPGVSRGAALEARRGGP